MLLKNKKTGEIVEAIGIARINGRTFVRFDDGKGNFKFEANSLAELNSEWEDYKEKEYFYLNMDGDIRHTTNQAMVKYSKEIGNYFETKEEAEKAVERLRAWKRLKDKGFRFKNWSRNQAGTIDIFCWDNFPYNQCVKKDLDLLFGCEK